MPPSLFKYKVSASPHDVHCLYYRRDTCLQQIKPLRWCQNSIIFRIPLARGELGPTLSLFSQRPSSTPLPFHLPGSARLVKASSTPGTRHLPMELILNDKADKSGSGVGESIKEGGGGALMCVSGRGEERIPWRVQWGHSSNRWNMVNYWTIICWLDASRMRIHTYHIAVE